MVVLLGPGSFGCPGRQGCSGSLGRPGTLVALDRSRSLGMPGICGRPGGPSGVGRPGSPRHPHPIIPSGTKAMAEVSEGRLVISCCLTFYSISELVAD